MTPVEFRHLLSTNHDAAVAALARAKVRDWMNDGEAEVARRLANRTRERLDLGTTTFCSTWPRGVFDAEDGPGHEATD